MPVDAPVLGSAQLARLSGSRLGRVLQFGETTSTNTVAAEMAREGAPEGLVVVADHQSAGRGRLDRRWEAPPGTSLLVSVLLRPTESGLPAARRYLAGAAVSLAVAEAAGGASGRPLQLKWPNDVVAPWEAPCGWAKVAGVLAEAGPGWLVVGVGVNVAWAPPGLPATCLEALAGRPVPRGEVLVDLLLALDRLYGRWDEVAGLYRRRCASLGRRVLVERPGHPSLEATAVDVDDEGCLQVALDDGTLERVCSADVTHARLAPG